MKINQIALRQKESHLLDSTDNNMSINISYPDPKIVSEKNNILQLLKRFAIQIVNDNNKTVIAKFLITVQCEVELENGESFIIPTFNNLLLPTFYSYLTQMMGEMVLPMFPLSVLYDYLNST